MNWWKLRSVGNLYVLKVSYLVLLIAPLLSKHEAIAQTLGLAQWLVATLFTASFSLAIANLAYDIWCPTIIKRFASPNDLYARMLEIRELSTRLYPGDTFDASLNHCTTAYESASQSRSLARWICTVLFILSGIAFAVILVYRALVVFGSLI